MILIPNDTEASLGCHSVGNHAALVHYYHFSICYLSIRQNRATLAGPYIKKQNQNTRKETWVKTSMI